VSGIINDILDSIFIGERAVADCLADLLARVDRSIQAKERTRGRPPKESGSRQGVKAGAALPGQGRSSARLTGSEKWSTVKIDDEGEATRKSIFLGDEGEEGDQVKEGAVVAGDVELVCIAYIRSLTCLT